MTRSTFTAPYSPISLPAATLSTATGDDVAQSAIPIGFTFNYLGTNYTAIGVNTNGAASFSPVMSTSGTNNNLFVANAPNLTLAPWWDNLWSDTVLYQLQGTPGNQTFTIQWTNSFSYFNTSTQLLNFQIILYETTNVIEFSYGNFVPGTAAVNESACIGIEGATGGAGNYLDAVTGSAFTSNALINAATQWPSHNFRFTPGAPSVLAGGTYTVGLTGNYFSLSEAIADVNHRGISGPVTLSLIDAAYDVTPANGDNFFPVLVGPVSGSSSSNTLSIIPASGTSTISSEGSISANGNCGNAAANNVITNANEPIISFVGTNYVSMQNINLTCSSTGVVDRGLQIINSSATAGSQNNTFQNITVLLNRANTGCYGISQQAITNPTALSGTNSNNSYYNLDISNVYTGIYLNGNANFPDANCVVGNTSPTSFNMIGGANANDIGNGNGATASYGIRANNESSVSIYNNEVRNVSHAGTASAEGIVIDAGQGTGNNVYMNKVHDINYTGTINTGNVTGIRVNVANTGTHSINVYNNFVYNLGSTYSGPATATRQLRGIYAQSNAGGAATETISIDFNNVRIDGSSAPNVSSTCFDVQTTTGPVINTRNNIFANFTGAQAGAAMHLCMATPTTNAIGNTGSISNNNDLFVNDPANGFTGRGATTNYATLSNWQTAMLQDANSLAVDPGFNSATDLHVSAPALDGAALTGIAYVTVDIDNQARSITPDIGADEFTPLLLDAGVINLVAPLNNGCHTAAEQVSVTLKNFASVPLDFTTDNVTVTVNVSGAITQTLNFTINNNSLNGNLPLPSGNSIIVPVGTINMSTPGTYVFDSYSTLSGDGNAVNDTMTTVNINYLPGNALANPQAVCAGSGVTLTLNGFSPGGSIQWQSSTDNGVTWVNETGPGNNTASYSVIPVDTTWYRSLFCGILMSNVDTVLYYNTTTPTTVNDTICGPGTATVMANGTGTMNWYDSLTGGSFLASGNSYSTSVSTTTTFYVSSTVGSLAQNVGLYDNSAGGAMSASNNNLIFDVMQNCVLDGVYIYPNAAGNAIVELYDGAANLITSATVAVSAADINQRTFIPLNFNLTPGTNYALVRNAASVNMWRNNVGVNYPYTLPGIVSITGSTAGAGFYYFFYNWQISYGCEGPRTPATIVVNSPTPVTISATSTSFCLGDSTTLTVSSTDLTYTYTWSPATGLNTTTGATVIATPTASTQYVVTGNSVSTGCNATDTVNIIVNPLPSVAMNVADTLICAGSPDTIVVCSAQNVGLFDNSAGGNTSLSANNLIFDVLANCTLNGVYVYPGTAGILTIDLEDNTNAVINSATYNVSAAEVGNRIFVPLNFNLTPATGMQLVRNAISVDCWRNNVGVNYPYTIPGVISITGSTAGAGFYYFFYNWEICTTSPNYTYAWTSVPAGYSGTSDTAFVAPTVSTQYIVTVTDNSTGCSNTFSTNVNVAPPVSATISGTSSICQGDSTILVANYSGGNGTVTYLWDNSSTNDSITVTPGATTTYTCTITDGCGSVSTATSTVTVNAGPPTAGFTYSITGLMTYTFADASVNATSWSWDFGDSQTSTSQNPTNVYAFQGTYTVTLIVTNGCGTDTITQVIVVDGINVSAFANTVSIYPNPASGQFNISFENNSASIIKMELFDLEGKLMQANQFSNIKAGTVESVNVNGYAPGMYMLKLSDEKGSAVFKITVE